MCMASRVTDQRQPGSEAATVYTRDSLRGATENTVYSLRGATENTVYIHMERQCCAFRQTITGEGYLHSFYELQGHPLPMPAH